MRFFLKRKTAYEMRISDWSSDVCASDRHVSGVGRRAVEHLARETDAAHLLGAQRIFEVGEARPLELETLVDMVVRGAARRHEQVPDARGFRLGLQILDDLDHLPAIAGAVLLLVGCHGGADLALDDFAYAALPMLLSEIGSAHV